MNGFAPGFLQCVDDRPGHLGDVRNPAASTSHGHVLPNSLKQFWPAVRLGAQSVADKVNPFIENFWRIFTICGIGMSFNISLITSFIQLFSSFLIFSEKSISHGNLPSYTSAAQ